MKSILPFFVIYFLGGCISNENAKNNSDVTLATKMDSVSYALGTESVKMLPKAYPEINLSVFQSGLEDKINNNELIDSLTSQKIIENYISQKQIEGYENYRKNYENIIKEGEVFLEKNKNKEGVIQLPSGLQYEILKKGKGKKPTQNDIVEIHYYDTYIDGSVYYNSYEQGSSISVPVNGAFPGWAEALSMMTVGSKWKLYIPYNLAFGEKGDGQKIGPFATIISEIELINIKQ